MIRADSYDLSSDPSTLAALTDDQRTRLMDLMDRYLAALETGAPLDREQLLGEHPDLAEALGIYLDRLEELHEVAAGFANFREDKSGDKTTAGEFDADSVVVPEEERRIGDFRIVREIGRGGMGVVYEAIQLSLSRRVALKILPFAAVLDSKQIARFRNEAQAAAQLFHPSIVPVYAVGVERGVHYYAMKYIDGQPLDQAIAQLRESQPQQAGATERTVGTTEAFADPPKAGSAERRAKALNETIAFPASPTQRSAPAVTTSRATGQTGGLGNGRREQIRTAIRLGIQAAEALHAAHEYGIIHRDIKPSNLMVDIEGQLWITDFGLARLPSEASLTRTGDVVGTLRYMSPEQARGQSSLVDARSDLYSLGVTIYELLTLEPAHRGDDPQSLLRRIGTQPIEPARKRCPDIPVDLDTVIAKATAPAAADRYNTAHEFADDLRRVLEGKPTLAKPPTVFDRVNKWTRRHTRLVLSVAAASILLTVGLSTATFLIARSKAQADSSFAKAERNFRTAHDTVDRFGARLAQRLEKVPGASEVRRDLLRETLAYYQDFVTEAENDPTLRADLALTYSKIGTMTEEFGSLARAIEAHEKSVELFGEVVSARPEEHPSGDDAKKLAENTRRLALAHNNLASALAKAGKLSDATTHYSAAIEIQQQLLDANPNGEAPRADLAQTLSNFGQLQRETVGAKVAEQTLRRAIGYQEKLVKEFASNTEHLRSLAVSYNNLSGLFVDRAPQQAKQHFASARALQQKILDLEPQNAVARSELAVIYNNLASIESRMNRLDEAAAAYDRAIDLRQDLLRAAPSQRIYRHDLALALNNLGSVQSQQHHPDKAQQSFHRALQLQETLVAGHEQDAELRGSLGGIYNNLGIALEELRHAGDAADAYRKAIDHQKAALQAAPSVERYRAYLSKHYFNYGRVLRQLGRFDDAIQCALERKTLWPKQADRLVTVAEELALAHHALSRAKGTGPTEVNAGAVFTPSSADRCEQLVFDTLGEAIAADASIVSAVKQSEAFADLRSHARYQKMVTQQ